MTIARLSDSTLNPPKSGPPTFTGNANFSNAATGTYTDGGIDYKYVTFTSSGTLTITQAGQADILVIAGGGGGGSGDVDGSGGGGGGAGGYRLYTGTTAGFNVGTETVTIGAGGAGGVASISGRPGALGSFSQVGYFRTPAGAGGGKRSAGYVGGSGSGGGSSNNESYSGGKSLDAFLTDAFGANYLDDFVESIGQDTLVIDTVFGKNGGASVIAATPGFPRG